MFRAAQFWAAARDIGVLEGACLNSDRRIEGGCLSGDAIRLIGGSPFLSISGTPLTNLSGVLSENGGAVITETTEVPEPSTYAPS